MINVESIVKRYKEVVALDHFSMEVRENEILGLLGPNGSGKTTAINCMLGLLKFDKGKVEIMGEEMRPDRYKIKAQIGLVPQEVALFDNLTVYENIDYFAGLYIENSKYRRDAIEYAIDFVELRDYKKFKIKKLSGGLRRRANIACGIAHKPKLVFFDEPTVAVDAQSRKFILDGIKKLSKNGTTVVYTTHYLEEAEELCDRIVIMDRGKSIAKGTVDELKREIYTKEIITLSFDENREEYIEDFRRLPNIIDVEFEKNHYILKFENNIGNLESILEYINKKNLVYTEIYSELPSLNDVFLELTGKELRD
ncbi:MAG: ABC transporter ATP-binding protein [Tissierellia bacterium]|nr:ABC transporter ATP-binding protein [Tissierellia bacterium]